MYARGMGACYDPSSGEEIGCQYPTTMGVTTQDYLGAWSGQEGVTNATPADYAAALGMPGTGGISSWLQQNKTAVYAGAGILVLMAMFKGRR